MPKIEIGLKGNQEMVVGLKDLAGFSGNIGAEVLSTHLVILLMENAARKAIEGHLPQGAMTVGRRFWIKHRAAVPIGSKVRAEAFLKEMRGRRLIFDVTAYDDFEKIAVGENEQIIVSIDAFLRKVNQKKINR